MENGREQCEDAMGEIRKFKRTHGEIKELEAFLNSSRNKKESVVDIHMVPVFIPSDVICPIVEKQISQMKKDIEKTNELITILASIKQGE